MKTIEFTAKNWDNSTDGCAIKIRSIVKLARLSNLVIWVNGNGYQVSIEYSNETELQTARDIAKTAKMKEFSR